PTAGFSGTDSFSYRAVNKAGYAATATVTITVLAPPVANDDAYSVVAGSVLNVPAPGVLANDTDPDSPDLRATVLAGPAHGTLTPQASAPFAYTPTAGPTGADSFPYRVTDQTNLSSTATVAISVTPASAPPGTTPPAGNAAPTAASDSFIVAV